MGYFSNKGRKLFPRAWSQFLISSSQLRLVGPIDPKTGPAQVSNEWPFNIRGPKPNLDHVKGLSLIIEYASHEEACSPDKPVRAQIIYLFSTFNHLFPPRPPCLSHECSNSLTIKEVKLRLPLRLGCLTLLQISGSKCLPCCASWKTILVQQQYQ